MLGDIMLGKMPAEEIAARVKLVELVGVKLVKGVSDEALAKLLRHVGGDSDLAATAMFLLPRPQWVVDIIGVIPS